MYFVHYKLDTSPATAMSTGPPSYYNNNNSRPPSADVAATITINLDPQQQELVNFNRHNLYTEDKKIGHNRRINLFIAFVEENAAADPNFIGEGTIDADVVVGVDFELLETRKYSRR